MQVHLSSDERFLTVHFDAPMRTLSWAIVGGGFDEHERVVFHFVRREELDLSVDPCSLLSTRLDALGLTPALGFLTARHLAPYADVRARSGDVDARALVTAGLGNALRAGDGTSPAAVGTINVLVTCGVALDDLAMLEALALAAEARTAALLTLDVPSRVSGRPASGTGTDCIAIACPTHGAPMRYAGKHTDVGSALGRAVHEATLSACRAWLAETAAPSAEHEARLVE